jgi:large subunit ribosomal protein L6
MFIDIPYPSHVSLHLSDGQAPSTCGEYLHVDGPLGTLVIHLPTVDPDGVCFLHLDTTHLRLCTHARIPHARALSGTLASLVRQSIEGVTQGWVISLMLTGVGCRADMKGSMIDLKLGQSHDILLPLPSEVRVLCRTPTHITVYGIDKAKVGQVAATLRACKPADAYKGKGIRYATETVRLKEGKKK